jgi:hypothetical protein
VSAIIRQADPRWSKDRVGDGAGTFAAVGCLVCCIQQAAMDLVDGALSDDPRIANMRGKEAEAFVGSSAIIEKLAAANGMHCTPRLTGDVIVLRAHIIAALITGKKVLLHVDYDSSSPKGDEQGDHWILGRTYVTPSLSDTTGEIICADPATGREARITTATLRGESGWRDGRDYVVTGVRVLSQSRLMQPT